MPRLVPGINREKADGAFECGEDQLLCFLERDYWGGKGLKVRRGRGVNESGDARRFQKPAADHDQTKPGFQPLRFPEPR